MRLPAYLPDGGQASLSFRELNYYKKHTTGCQIKALKLSFRWIDLILASLIVTSFLGVATVESVI